MRKRKEDLQFVFKEGTTAEDILQGLIDAEGCYPEEGLKVILSEKKPDTVRKMIRRLERAGYVSRKKGIKREIVVFFSPKLQNFLDMKEIKIGNSPQKITRQGDLAVITMMFKRSTPVFDGEEALQDSYYLTKKQIIEREPASQKVLNTSRFAGVYAHYGEYIPVFKFTSSMYWVDHVEFGVKTYLENQIFNAPITKAIFLIEDYEKEAMMFFDAPEEKRMFGKSLRDSLELSSCYEKVYLFATDLIGVEQLRFFRTFQDIEEAFLNAVFEESQRVNNPDTIVDGHINAVNCIVLFSGDIVQIKRIRRILNAGMLPEVNIFCYDFQEKFLRTAFESCSERVRFSSYPLEALIDLYAGEE